MFATYLTGAFVPFTAALALFAALLLLELAFLVVGGSLLGGASVDAPDMDALDAELSSKPDLAGSGLAAFLGLGRAPFLIWLCALLASFGLTGFSLQSAAVGIAGQSLPVAIVIPLALGVGVFVARAYSGMFARLIPGTETSAQSKQALSRLRGVVSQGTARSGHPAEVRVTDRHGNLQFLRAEPLDRNAEIHQGQEVLVLRVPSGPDRGAFRIIAVSD